MMEFESSGRFLRARGDGRITCAHTVRVDRAHNAWIVDDGARVVRKMSRLPGRLNAAHAAAMGPKGEMICGAERDWRVQNFIRK